MRFFHLDQIGLDPNATLLAVPTWRRQSRSFQFPFTQSIVEGGAGGVPSARTPTFPSPGRVQMLHLEIPTTCIEDAVAISFEECCSQLFKDGPGGSSTNLPGKGAKAHHRRGCFPQGSMSRAAKGTPQGAAIGLLLQGIEEPQFHAMVSWFWNYHA